ncbi:SRPBCC family protein [Nocardia goodfellowii]|uniref:Uncharacterized protein YndB with AHSA1/START domain n=1 Tax=Nocardia goodfellowii TaxID=882446 RepID=A0ABS4Q8D7_9NOCA|nr:SRPBCC family protein [Nocardia goodfellowii]MBP2187949.1 uncharacterized protein YndB with AHSA1/START domain [Nocardia goodfellowii]
MRTKIDIHFTVDATPTHVFEALAAVEMFPEWSSYQDARVATRDQDNRPTKIYVTADVHGSSDLQVLEWAWTEDRVTWQIIDSSRGIRGGGWFEVAESDGETQVWYHAEMQTKIPLPGLLMKRTQQRWHETIVENFIEYAESYPDTESYEAYLDPVYTDQG